MLDTSCTEHSQHCLYSGKGAELQVLMLDEKDGSTLQKVSM